MGNLPLLDRVPFSPELFRYAFVAGTRSPIRYVPCSLDLVDDEMIFELPPSFGLKEVTGPGKEEPHHGESLAHFPRNKTMIQNTDP